MKGLKLTPLAESDIEEIVLYSIEQWGEEQAQAYLHALSSLFSRLQAHPFSGRERLDIRAGVRAIPCREHIVYYRVPAQHVEVLRVLHSRRDPHRAL